MYNTTYRVNLQDEEPVVLRLAPEPECQFNSERELMRNEYASIAHLGPIAHLMPDTLFADFSQQLIGRDYLIQSWLGGIPAAQGLSAWPRERQGSFWRDLGSILARIHSVRGSTFGRVLEPVHASLGEATRDALAAIASDLDNTGLDARDIRQVAVLAASNRAILDEVAEARLLHGVWWFGTGMLDAGSPAPRISGVFDCDRTSWGDPMADWTMFLLERRTSGEQQHFWNGYGGAPPDSEHARIRRQFHRARSLAEARLEYRRLQLPERIPATYAAMSEVLAELLPARRYGL
jgi:aminoglycoside phosphotransferase (APT) family kinase protein